MLNFFKNIKTIKTKIIIKMIFFGLCLFVYTYFIYMFSSKITQNSQSIAESNKHIIMAKDTKFYITEVQQWLTDISAARAEIHHDEGFVEAEKYAVKFRQGVETYKIYFNKKNDKVSLNNINVILSDFEDYYRMGIMMANQYIDYGPSKGNIYMAKFDPLADSLNEKFDNFVNVQLMKHEQGIISLGSIAKQMILYILLIGIILCTFVIIFELILTFELIKPLKDLVNRIKLLGEGDLTAKCNVINQDEIGNLANFYNLIIISLNSLVTEIKQQIMNLDNVSTKLAETSEDSSASLKQINSNIFSMKEKTSKLDDEIIKFKSHMNEVNNNVVNVAEIIINESTDITQSSAAIEEITSSIKNINSTIKDKTETVRNLKKIALAGKNEMKETIQIIKKINNSTNVIMDILDVIDNIANQTNLLSINAAIEAAHAGESGKGFSIVADKIGILTENTVNNSKSISKSLKEIISYINISEASSKKTGEYFKNINNEIEQVDSGMFEIKNAMNELLSGSQQIITSLSSLIETSENVKESTNIMKEKVFNINSSIEKVSIISKDSKESIIEFTSGIEEIVKSVNLVAESGAKNTESVSVINQLINKFKTA